MKSWSREKGLKAGAVALAALLSGCWVLVALGAGQGTDQGGRVAHRYRVVLTKVGLSHDQDDAIRGLMAAEEPALSALQVRRSASFAALKTVLRAAQPDPTAVGMVLLRVHVGRQALRAEMRKLHDGTVAQLTPEQKFRFDAYLDAFRMMRHRRADFS